MKNKILCVLICLFLIMLMFTSVSGLELKETKSSQNFQNSTDEIDEGLLIASIPYYRENTQIEFTDGDEEEIKEIEELLKGRRHLYPIRENIEVHNISFNITYTGRTFRTATFSYVHMAWFEPHFDYVDLINKQFTCSIKNYTGYFDITRFRLYRLFQGFFCPMRINLFGTYDDGTINAI